MTSDERTPLIATVQVAPPRQRYTHQTLRRFCTIALNSSLVALFILFLLPLSLYPWHGGHQRPHSPDTDPVSYRELQDILLSTPSGEKAREWSKYHTSGPHLAGKNFSQASWTQERWQEFGIQADIVSYDVYLNYPLGHRLALYEKPVHSPKQDNAWKVKFEATLEEDVLAEDETTGLKDRIPTFHGYSASGNVTAPFVWVNYGTYQDFEDLIKANISLDGHIAIARYGAVFRGLKCRRAEERGMVGMVMFMDPDDDGNTTEANGFKTYPQSPARNPSSVQRRSTSYLSSIVGDPTTPGYASKPGVPRQSVNGTMPSIPSLPISYIEALPILRSLNGHGLSSEDLPTTWQQHRGLKYKGVKYNVGPSPDNLRLTLINQQDYIITPIWDVIGVINGTLSDEVIIIGNHRDAWVAGGAGDPASGSAVLNEIIRAFGIALSKGWKPLRTIVFASWDGEEYNLLGSTEWVEEHLPWLSGCNVAYINMDLAVNGGRIWANAHPLLRQVFESTLSLVASPDPTHQDQTVRELWNGKFGVTGSGSDFTAFQDHAGIPCIDVGFGGNPSDVSITHDVIYQYHSNYDSFHWMETYGDPGFHYHAALAQVVGLIVAKMSTSPTISFNATVFATEIETYISAVEAKVDTAVAGIERDQDTLEARTRPSPQISKGQPSSVKRRLKALHTAATDLRQVASAHDSIAVSLSSEAGKDIPWWKVRSKLRLYNQIRKVNNKYKLLDRDFLHPDGLDGRPWFKHVIYAPGLWTGYDGTTFPGLVEAVDKRDWERAREWAIIIKGRIDAATKTLS